MIEDCEIKAFILGNRLSGTKTFEFDIIVNDFYALSKYESRIFLDF